ncbi:MAG TPA: class I SAM-dependent methyltransferase [Nitrospiraceae bacterium]|nr:class I SAM-dependent methyltransferase [Nitrospiraceae bacterium]
MDAMQRLNKVRAESGDWTAHPVSLPGGISTMECFNANHFLYLSRIVQVAKDIVGASLRGSRVLDLACLEGGFAVEFALCGAEVVAIEGRQDNIRKLEYVKEELGLFRIRTVHADVRDISIQKYGLFDCVLCLGILYHLDKSSIGRFLRSIAEMTSRVAIIDTHVSLYGGESCEIEGVMCHGATYPEHRESDSVDDIESRKWASLNNRDSFFLTAPSLLTLLRKIGFTSVYICEMPYYDIMTDRRTIVAIKGVPHQLTSFRAGTSQGECYPEYRHERVIHPTNARKDESTQSVERTGGGVFQAIKRWVAS